MSTTKNPIIEQIKRNYEELKTARQYCFNSIKVLAEDSFILKAEVRILLQEMPHFVFLKHQEDFIRGTLRKVCSGELEFFEAREIIRTVYIQIMDAMSVINETMLK